MNHPIFTQFRYSDSDSPHHEHYHLSGEMVFVEEGEAEFVISGKIYRAEKNSILFINSYEPHETRILSALSPVFCHYSHQRVGTSFPLLGFAGDFQKPACRISALYLSGQIWGASPIYFCGAGTGNESGRPL